MADEPEVSPAPVKTRMTTIWVVAGLAVVMGAVGIFFWASSPGRSTNAASAESNSEVESTLALETFIVNLKGGERAYLRVGITLALSHPLPKQRGDGNAAVALVRDTIVDVLTTASPEQLLQPEGKHQLKTQVLDALSQRAPELGIKDVYFTEFLVQM